MLAREILPLMVRIADVDAVGQQLVDSPLFDGSPRPGAQTFAPQYWQHRRRRADLREVLEHRSDDRSAIEVDNQLALFHPVANRR